MQHQTKKAAGGSFGHGGFLGIGAYVTALLWNYLHVTPWLGIPLSMLAVAAVAVLIGHPSLLLRNHRTLFRPVLQIVTATRDVTGGSLGYTPERYHSGSSVYGRAASPSV